MPTIAPATNIAAPPERVWALLEDVRRLPVCSASTEEVHDAPERITTVGQDYPQVDRLLGIRLTSRWRVAALEPGRLLCNEGSLAPG